eukprot:scaffold54652_cov14-Tisochrysis_lutea.AAC.1
MVRSIPCRPQHMVKGSTGANRKHGTPHKDNNGAGWKLDITDCLAVAPVKRKARKKQGSCIYATSPEGLHKYASCLQACSSIAGPDLLSLLREGEETTRQRKVTLHQLRRRKLIGPKER